MNFVPNQISSEIEVPFFDDMREKKIAGYATERPIKLHKKEIADALAQLDAFAIRFDEGAYPGQPLRFGFRITFSFNGVPGRIDCAALPIRSFTEHKKDRALAQALYLVSVELKAAANAWVYKPGSVPLLPYLIGRDGQTVTEGLVSQGIIPDVRPIVYLPEPK